jgi:hypothetical protein
MNKKLASVKNAVVANKTRILVTATVIATAVAAIEVRAIKQHNDFLKEKGLYEEYYTVED